MAEEVLEESLYVRKGLGEAICKALAKEGRKLGFSANELPDISWESADFSVTKDPSDGQECLAGDWKDSRGGRVGSIQFNSDGSFYAEYDIVKSHPTDSRWFVEAVTAWGRDNNIKTEPRLLAAV